VKGRKKSKMISELLTGTTQEIVELWPVLGKTGKEIKSSESLICN
jgi:hypothetical protein